MTSTNNTDKMTYDFRVRQVRRGFWTYDIFCVGGYEPEEYSVGECFSRRDAEKTANAACRQKEKENN